MMQLESQNMDREQEMVMQYNGMLQSLQGELKVAQNKVEQGEEATKELQKAQEEIEILNQDRTMLSEASEKLCIYKAKVGEMQDIKEAFKREQEAHAKSVDEIVRLENELQHLQPLKRQLEDYKVRSIEAEVKLVECQDYLRRIEREANDQSAVNDTLRQSALMQKEQVEELQ